MQVRRSREKALTVLPWGHWRKMLTSQGWTCKLLEAEDDEEEEEVEEVEG